MMTQHIDRLWLNLGQVLYWRALLRVVASILFMGTYSFLIAEPIHWSHGTWDNDGAPKGRLLSDNAGYWGDTLLTGVEYTYLSNVSNPPDSFGGDREVFGRRLLDGKIQGDWHVPVGQNRDPLVVIFDFKRPSLFTEVDLFASRNYPHTFTLEVSDENDGPWIAVYEQSSDVDHQTPLYRAIMPSECRGRYLKLSFKGSGTSLLDEVVVWGDGEVSSRYPEDIRPVKIPVPSDGMRQSLPGITKTQYRLEDFETWQKNLGQQAALPVLFALSTSQPNAPLLPVTAQINAPLTLTLARNEIESRYLSVVNPSEQPVTFTLNVTGLASESGLSATLLAGGILPVNRPTRQLTNEERLRLFITTNLPPDAEPEGDMQVLPFFAPGQQLCPSLMRRYLANAENILYFPELTLDPGAAAIIMLRLKTSDSKPGRYQAQVQAVTVDGRQSRLPLMLEVVNLSFPDPDVWMRVWGAGTRQFPFESESRFINDVKSVRELGATVWGGFPKPRTKAAFFAATGRTHHHIMMRPKKYIHLGHGGKLAPEDLTEEDREELIREARQQVSQAEKLGLSYDQWFLELWDEPGEGNSEIYGELARIIKGADPHIRIYMNPLFWRPGFPPQEVILKHLQSYYNELIDISVPITNLLGDNQTTRELWAEPHFVRAHYIHPARRAGRGMSWKTFRHDFNGWGYYCYYAPRGNAWDIKTWGSLGFAYQMVFPGVDGPIITPIYEIMREGWEDFCILTALKEHGFNQLLDELLKESQQKKADLGALRTKALQVFSEM